jgi:hypothetical protein
MVARRIRRGEMPVARACAPVHLSSNRHRIVTICRYVRPMSLANRLPQRPLGAPRLLAIGSALLWGALEFVALWRSRWAQRTK